MINISESYLHSSNMHSLMLEGISLISIIPRAIPGSAETMQAIQSQAIQSIDISSKAVTKVGSLITQFEKARSSGVTTDELKKRGDHLKVVETMALTGLRSTVTGFEILYSSEHLDKIHSVFSQTESEMEKARLQRNEEVSLRDLSQNSFTKIDSKSLPSVQVIATTVPGLYVTISSGRPQVWKSKMKCFPPQEVKIDQLPPNENDAVKKVCPIFNLLLFTNH